MTDVRVFVALLALTALAFLPARGDDGVFSGSAGSVLPSQSRSVVMIAEEVVLDITDPRVVHGSCTFIFKNTGAPESLLVGFPDMSAAGAGGLDLRGDRIVGEGESLGVENLPL